MSKNRVSIVAVAIAIACLALANLACSGSGGNGCQPGNAVSATTGADCSQGSTSSTNAAAPRTPHVSGEFFILMERSPAWRRLFVEPTLFLVYLPTFTGGEV